MNRLWVRLSLAIALIAILVSFFPFAMRLLQDGPAPFRSPPPEAFENRQVSELQRTLESRIWANVARGLVVGAGVGVLAGVALSWWLISPLKNLEAGAKAIAEQRLDYRVPVRGSLEVQWVARSFNQMAAELSRQEALRQNMLADVTHELRHPLHILQGNLQAIIDGVYPLNMEEIALLSEQAQHLNALVNDLHELAQAEAHELPLTLSPTGIGPLAEDIAALFAPLALEKEITLQTEELASLPQVDIDPGRMRQVLSNLLSNALQHTPRGGSVSLRGAITGDELALTIRDTGEGMTPEETQAVFNRFYRGDASRRRDEGGAGLGLAITKAIVEAHGGRIQASSAGKGQGSALTIFLKLRG